MSSFFSYNGLNHTNGTVNPKVRFDAILSGGQEIVAYKARADIEGWIISQAATQADITAQIEAIQAAYVDGGDLILYLNDGSEAPTSIYSGLTLGGTKVVQAPSFPDNSRAAYVTNYHWTAAIEAEIPTIAGNTALWSWEESLTFEGTGGPDTDVIECVQGGPIPQTLKQRTAMTAIQEGRAVGYRSYWLPMYNTPFWPQLEQQKYRIQRPMSAKVTRAGFTVGYKEFPTIWRYQFKSADPITGVPTPWPI